MRATHWLMTALLGLPIVGCAGSSTEPGSFTQEAQQALAPTGKLRVALQLANPLNVVQDRVGGNEGWHLTSAKSWPSV